MRRDDNKFPRLVVITGSVGAVIGGFMPILLSLIGIWQFLEWGYLYTRGREQVELG